MHCIGKQCMAWKNDGQAMYNRENQQVSVKGYNGEQIATLLDYKGYKWKDVGFCGLTNQSASLSSLGSSPQPSRQ
jgi:hypothetical protein